MKIKLLYILPVIAILSSCLSNKVASNPVPTPTGAFTGTFTQLHYHLKAANVYADTLKANVQLSLQQAAGFKLTGDTSTVIAGSHGSYSLNSSYIQFTDATYPATGTPTKTHLNGVFQYSYNGSNLQMVSNNTADTTVYSFNLTKSN